MAYKKVSHPTVKAKCKKCGHYHNKKCPYKAK